MPWESEEQFRAKAEGLSGLPKKIVKHILYYMEMFFLLEHLKLLKK